MEYRKTREVHKFSNIKDDTPSSEPLKVNLRISSIFLRKQAFSVGTIRLYILMIYV
jgi:hypothetical protein